MRRLWAWVRRTARAWWGYEGQHRAAWDDDDFPTAGFVAWTPAPPPVEDWARIRVPVWAPALAPLPAPRLRQIWRCGCGEAHCWLSELLAAAPAVSPLVLASAA